jgi:dephospho-CoA kinase
VAGLTGGIATGKSTVSAALEDAGAIVIDADEIAREVVKKGQPALQSIVDCFGKQILQPNEEIDRARLADIIFKDEKQKLKLNSIVHPYVIDETARRLEEIKKQRPDAIVILDVPLLFEAGMLEGLDEVIVVYIPEHIQLKRLTDRDHLSAEEAFSRIRSQMPIEEKKNRATIVIDNSHSRGATRRQAMEVFRRLLKKNG